MDWRVSRPVLRIFYGGVSGKTSDRKFFVNRIFSEIPIDRGALRLVRLGRFQASDVLDRFRPFDFKALAPARNFTVPLALHCVLHCGLYVSEARGRERFALIYRGRGRIGGLHGTRGAILTAETVTQRAVNSADEIAKCGHGFSNLFVWTLPGFCLLASFFSGVTS
jgi:hypothetical protein